MSETCKMCGSRIARAGSCSEVSCPYAYRRQDGTLIYVKEPRNPSVARGLVASS